MERDRIIGTVTIDISPFFISTHQELHQGLEAWFPIYNVEKGLRGDLLVQIKFQLIKDENVAKNISSTEVEYYCTMMPPAR